VFLHVFVAGWFLVVVAGHERTEYRRSQFRLIRLIPFTSMSKNQIISQGHSSVIVFANTRAYRALHKKTDFSSRFCHHLPSAIH
jgi:hypothetical protein